MTSLKHVLAAGTVAMFALAAPVTLAAQPASAATVPAHVVQLDGGGSANGAANGSSGIH
ncbi:hypothetical protein [Nonomuraea sp. NPDC003754]